MNKESEPATKRDLSELAADIGARFDATKGDLAKLGTRLDAKIDAKFGTLDVKIDERFGVLDAKIDERFGALDAKIDERFGAADAKIDATSKTLALEIIRTQAELREVKETMSTKSQIDQLMRSFDEFTSKTIHYQRADALRGQALIKVESMADDHERRITALESARPRPSP